MIGIKKILRLENIISTVQLLKGEGFCRFLAASAGELYEDKRVQATLIIDLPNLLTEEMG